MESSILKENQAQQNQSLELVNKKLETDSNHNNLTLKLEPQDDLNPSNKDLSLDINNHSLALLGRSSIQRGIPIPRAMLSHSQDMGHALEEEDAGDLYYNHKIKMQVSDEEKQWFVQQLGLNELLYLRKAPNNTKNVLRNFGNAQAQFILYNAEAKRYAEQQLANPQKFYMWVRSLRLEKFDDFKEVWGNESNSAFRRVYRELCFKFYKQCSVPYVLSSRMKNTDTKLSHLRYIYRFLEGLKNPEEFTYFRKVEK